MDVLFRSFFATVGFNSCHMSIIWFACAQVDRDKRMLLPHKGSNIRKGSSSTSKEAKWGKGRGGNGPGMQMALKRESERWDPD